ncbi:MAG: extracellular solute-binding protein [Elusimicrobiota bacterium]
MRHTLSLTLFMFFGVSSAAAVELTYWPSSNPEEIKIAKTLVEEFNRLHPDITVRMQPLPATQSSEEVLLSAIVSGTTPDVCSNILPAIMGRLTKAGAVVALDRFADGERVITRRSGAQGAGMFRSPDGRLYQIPWKVNPVMLIYNTELFAQLGLAPPRTYGEFMRVAEALTRDADGNGRIDRWAMTVSIKTVWWQRFFDFYTFYVAATQGKTLLKNGKAVFNNAGGAAAMGFFREGFRRGVFPMTGFSGDLFVDGTVGMNVAGPWILKYYERRKPDLKFGVSPIPVPDGQAGPVHTYGDPKNIVIFSATRHPEESWEFAKFLISERADRMLIEVTNQIPLRRGLAEDPALESLFKGQPLLRAFALQAERTAPMDESPHLVQILDILSTQFEAAAVYRIISPEKSLDLAAQEIQDIYDYW